MTRRWEPQFNAHWLLAIAVIVSVVATPIEAESIDPQNDGSQYAFSPNVGWLNAEPGGDGGPGMLIEPDAVSGWLWSANFGWVSLSCRNTLSCGDVDYAVTYDGAGGLAGWAWAPNAGWMSFSCANTSSCGVVPYGVQVNSATGELTGFAFSPNLGWISFSCESTNSCADVEYGVTTAPSTVPVTLLSFAVE